MNDRLAADVKKYPNAHLIDWHDYGEPARQLVRAATASTSPAPARTGYAMLIREHLEAGY